MLNTKNTNNRVTTWTRWIARFWGTIIVICVLLVLIGTVWDWFKTGTADPYAVDNVSLIEYLGPVLITLSAIGLGIAWRWERFGGAIAFIFQLIFLTVHLIQEPISLTSSFIIPFLISLSIIFPGILFLFCWRRSRKEP